MGVLVSRISSKGQVTIPKKVRETLRARPGGGGLSRLTPCFIPLFPELLKSGTAQRMRRRSAPSEPWDVVVVPFPFADPSEGKRRPALVLSKASFNRRGHTMPAVITSAAQHS